MKKDTLLIRIIFATFTSITLSIVLYGVFVPLVINYSPDQTAHFVKKLLVNLITLGPLSTYIVFFNIQTCP